MFALSLSRFPVSCLLSVFLCVVWLEGVDCELLGAEEDGWVWEFWLVSVGGLRCWWVLMAEGVQLPLLGSALSSPCPSTPL